MSKILNWIAIRHWWLIGLVAVLLLGLENIDIAHLQGDSVHLVEFLIYLLMLLVIGVSFDSSFRSFNSRVKMNKIIELKHKLSLEFSIYNDWDVLVTQIARFPGTIAEVEQSFLYVCDPISNQFGLVAQWPSAGQKLNDSAHLESLERHLREKSSILFEFSQCGEDGLPGAVRPDALTFCLPIRYGQALLGMLGFKLKNGTRLGAEQQDIFKNIGDELGFALKVGQERKAFLEMSTSEVTLAERRRVSHYLHDHLGHNLGYLHFKLDQLISSQEQVSLESVMTDLEHLRKAAKDSYEIVRGTLETMQPETTPVLTNLLMEHARKVSRRANIDIDFTIKGKQYPVPTDIKRVIFYVFEEALSNSEKYAQANRITVLSEWGDDKVALTISDDGVGFNPDEVNSDQHFGLEILRERLEKVGGQVFLETAENQGTTLSVHIPISRPVTIKEQIYEYS